LAQLAATALVQRSVYVVCCCGLAHVDCFRTIAKMRRVDKILHNAHKINTERALKEKTERVRLSSTRSGVESMSHHGMENESESGATWNHHRQVGSTMH